MYRQYFLASFSVVAFLSQSVAFSLNIEQNQTKMGIIGLQEMASLCKNHMGNRQIQPGELEIKCLSEQVFWRPINTKKICLPNEGSQCTKSSIKDERYGSIYRSSGFGVQDQEGWCTDYEELTASTTVTHRGSCELISKILGQGSEVQYCERLLRGPDGGVDRIQQQEEAIYEAQQIQSQDWKALAMKIDPMSVFEPTGRRLICESNCEEGSSIRTNSSSSSESSSESASSSSSSSDWREIKTVQTDEAQFRGLGAPVEIVKVKNHQNLFDYLGHRTRVLQIKGHPSEGSLLYKLGLKKGDLLKKIWYKSFDARDFSSERIKTVRDLNKVSKAIERIRVSNKKSVDIKLELISGKSIKKHSTCIR